MNDVKQSVDKVTAINIYGGVNRNSSTVEYYDAPVASHRTAQQSKSIHIWLWLLTSAILGLVYLVINIYSQGVPYDNNSAGLLIAALGAMVAALVGWQVFNA